MSMLSTGVTFAPVARAATLAVGSLAIASLGVLATGCGSHTAALREAAAADLSCPKNRVHVLSSGKAREVEACGQHATYKWEDDDWRMVGRSAAPAEQPVMKAGPPGTAPAVAPAIPAPVMTPTGTPSQPPPSSPPPSSAATKQI
jgi:hypothetical protein